MAVVTVVADTREASSKVQMNCILFGMDVDAMEYDALGNPTIFDIYGDPFKAIRIAHRSGATAVAALDMVLR